MNNKKQTLSIFDKYLDEQAKYADSPFRKFIDTFTLSFILKKLDRKRREIFIGLIDEKKYVEILEFLDNTLPELADELPKALRKKLNKIMNKSIYERNN